MKDRVLIAWSTGKDSARALQVIQQSPESFEIAALLTTVTRDYDRVGMHGVRSELLQTQADAIGLPLEKVFITKSSTNEDYERAMRAALLKWKQRGVSAVVFGDLFLEDLRTYREDRLQEVGMGAIFPLWKQDTASLARQFIGEGFRAVVTCVDTRQLPASCAGAEYDVRFLSGLPDGVDPCGENGEFHTFVYDGPVFRRPLAFARGERVLRDEYFSFFELVPCSCKCSS